MAELLFKDEVYAIVGAAMEVHAKLGSGFLEAAYQQALEIEFGDRRIPHEAQKPIQICYKGRVLKCEYYADFFCFGEVIVEIKAIERLTAREEAQLLNYMKATGVRVGVLLNFGAYHEIQWKRMVL